MRETRPTFSTDWINESIANNTHVDLYRYSARTLCTDLPKKAGKKHRTSYSEKEDVLLVELVKEFADTNDYTLGGNRLWKRLEQEFRQRGYDRTYQSLKDHFRRHIACVSSLSADGVLENLTIPCADNSSDEGNTPQGTPNRYGDPSAAADARTDEEDTNRPQATSSAAANSQTASFGEDERRQSQMKPKQASSAASAASTQRRLDVKAEIDALSYSYGMSIPEVIAGLMECNGDLWMLKQKLRRES
eukprot:gb/GECG01002061.1/.p1 GENE.gb/GECG01002061.1/~~gb/GECG01002061.1/.p1  ORF type:complete len:247 (+),score=36.80 gb/GECG01002061.1/:1-741(+)